VSMTGVLVVCACGVCVCVCVYRLFPSCVLDALCSLSLSLSLSDPFFCAHQTCPPVLLIRPLIVSSTGFFIYAYSVFYFVYRSPMSGWLQATFFFGRMLVVCYFFWIMLGAVGFYSSLLFVRQIYRNLKCD
jgi:hypothetical protein